MKLHSFKKRFRFSAKISLIFFILVYVGLVNAYNLFYIPEEGKLLEFSGDIQNTRHVKYFEKVEIVKMDIGDAETTSIPQDKQSPEVLTRISDSKESEPLRRIDVDVFDESPQKDFTLNTPEFKPDYEISESVSEQETQSLTPPKKEDTVVEPVVLPISMSDVEKLSYKLELDSLKDGAILELRISESFSETFTIFVQNRQVYVNEGGTTDKDIQIGVIRSGFEELLSTNDVSSTAKLLYNDGEISVRAFSQYPTLWRKGYKKLGENLGLI